MSGHHPASRKTELADLAYACAVAPARQEGDLVRAALILLEAEADPPREALLASGGAAAAALRLVEQRGGYMLSCGRGGTHLATVALEGQGGEASAEGASAALALIGALAAALAGLEGEAMPAARRTGPSPALRLN